MAWFLFAVEEAYGKAWLHAAGSKRAKVSFYASFEVDQQIANFRNDTGRSPQAKHVLAILSWCLANTAQAIAENLPYWAAQGMNRFQKKDAYAKHYSTDAERCDLQSLAASCTEDENWQLQEILSRFRAQSFRMFGASYLSILQDPTFGCKL